MENNYFSAAGKMSLGSRLRLLTARITDDAKNLYGLYEVDLEPKWFPVFYVLSDNTEKTITEIAVQIGHSQPSVSKIVREMARFGLVLEKRASGDGRRNVVKLSKKGAALKDKINLQYTDVNAAVENILAHTTNDLWKAIEEWEYLLQQKSLFDRVKEQKKQREGSLVKIVAYDRRYRETFSALNKEWISKYFKMEASDHKALDNPEQYILNKGGCILIALYNGEAVGVCALIKMDDPEYDFELAKMAVSPSAQGRNIGWLLGNAILEKAKQMGGSTVYLESNTLLKPAISLYHKLGFKKISGRQTPYERCNIQMALTFAKQESK